MRSYFNVDNYISLLLSSDSITTCDAVPLPEISDNQNYIFISYSHRDYKQVYTDLAVMYHAGVRFWYDRGLAAGKDWDIEAKRIIESPHCVGVIFFLSENLFLSESVNKEIDLVRGNKEQSQKNYFCVNLTDVQPSRILRNIMRMDDVLLDSAGLDMERIGILAKAYSDKMTYLRFSDSTHRKDLIDQISMQFNVVEAFTQNRGYLVDKKTEHKIPITENNFIVGRARRKSHYSIEGDSYVSVVHFSIISSPKGSMIMDNGAENGTYVNKRRIPPMTYVPLNNLDEIAFGNQVFVFSLT